MALGVYDHSRGPSSSSPRVPYPRTETRAGQDLGSRSLAEVVTS